MMQPNRNHSIRTLSILLCLALLLVGCSPAWEFQISEPDGELALFNRSEFEALARFMDESTNPARLPLEQVLAELGYDLVSSATIVDSTGEEFMFEWALVAEDAWILESGRLQIQDQQIQPQKITLQTSNAWDVQARITDLAPTAAFALGLPAPGEAKGHVLTEEHAEHVLMIFLDAFGYIRYQESLLAGLIPNLSDLGEPLVAYTVYPPITSASSAAILTGAPPSVNGADQRGIRKTDAETLLDVATSAGLEVVAVEGQALAFNMRNAELILSGDKDGNGSTDDNVLANTMQVLEGGMPPLLWVHFHGIDDDGHTYGPCTTEEQATIREVDAAVGRILEAIPGDTLVLIFADHGMHAVEEDGRLGNHGHLIERDKLIPIWSVYLPEE